MASAPADDADALGSTTTLAAVRNERRRVRTLNDLRCYLLRDLDSRFHEGANARRGGANAWAASDSFPSAARANEHAPTDEGVYHALYVMICAGLLVCDWQTACVRYLGAGCGGSGAGDSPHTPSTPCASPVPRHPSLTQATRPFIHAFYSTKRVALLAQRLIARDPMAVVAHTALVAWPDTGRGERLVVFARGASCAPSKVPRAPPSRPPVRDLEQHAARCAVVTVGSCVYDVAATQDVASTPLHGCPSDAHRHCRYPMPVRHGTQRGAELAQTSDPRSGDTAQPFGSRFMAMYLDLPAAWADRPTAAGDIRPHLVGGMRFVHEFHDEYTDCAPDEDDSHDADAREGRKPCAHDGGGAEDARGRASAHVASADAHPCADRFPDALRVRVVAERMSAVQIWSRSTRTLLFGLVADVAARLAREHMLDMGSPLAACL